MITDDRLAELISMLERDSAERYYEDREMGGSDLSSAAEALRELQQLRQHSLILCRAVDKAGIGACVYWLVNPEEEPEIGQAVAIGEQAASAIKAMLT